MRGHNPCSFYFAEAATLLKTRTIASFYYLESAGTVLIPRAFLLPMLVKKHGIA
jgi:hypothetical protein